MSRGYVVGAWVLSILVAMYASAWLFGEALPALRRRRGKGDRRRLYCVDMADGTELVLTLDLWWKDGSAEVIDVDFGETEPLPDPPKRNLRGALW